MDDAPHNLDHGAGAAGNAAGDDAGEAVYARAAIALTAAAAAARAVLSALPGLGADEANHWLYAAHPAAGYFDHPPMVGILVRLTTLGCLLDHEFFVRLAGAAFQPLTAAVVWLFAAEAAGRRAAFTAVLLYHLSFSFFLSTVFILPDTPMLFFWLLSAFMFWKGVKTEGPGRAGRLMVALAGIPLGLAMLSKYHGLMLWPSVALWLLADRKRRRWMLRPEPWVALAIAAAFFAPAFIWNLRHDMVSFRFQGGRGLVSIVAGLVFGGGEPVRVNPGWPVAYLLSQALWTNPFVAGFTVAGLVAVARRRLELAPGSASFMLFAALPMIAFFTLNSAGNPASLPHWTSAAWLTMLPLGAAFAAGKDPKGAEDGPRKPIRGAWLPAAAAATVLFYALAAAQFLAHPVDVDSAARRIEGAFGRKQADPGGVPDDVGSRDPTLESVRGAELAAALDGLRERDRARFPGAPDPIVLTRQWYVAGKAHHAMHRRPWFTLACWGSLRNVRSMAFMQDYAVAPGTDAYHVLASTRFKPEYLPEREFAGVFESFEETIHVPVVRGGRVVMKWYITPCRRLSRPPPPPHPAAGLR